MDIYIILDKETVMEIAKINLGLFCFSLQMQHGMVQQVFIQGALNICLLRSLSAGVFASAAPPYF